MIAGSLTHLSVEIDWTDTGRTDANVAASETPTGASGDDLARSAAHSCHCSPQSSRNSASRFAKYRSTPDLWTPAPSAMSVSVTARTVRAAASRDAAASMSPRRDSFCSGRRARWNEVTC